MFIIEYDTMKQRVNLACVAILPRTRYIRRVFIKVYACTPSFGSKSDKTLQTAVIMSGSKALIPAGQRTIVYPNIILPRRPPHILRFESSHHNIWTALPGLGTALPGLINLIYRCPFQIKFCYNLNIFHFSGISSIK